MPGNPDTRASDGREGTYVFVLPWELERSCPIGAESILLNLLRQRAAALL
jgi:hypothetical protein